MDTSGIHRPGASRRAFLVKAASAGTVLSAGIWSPQSARADDDNDDQNDSQNDGPAKPDPWGHRAICSLRDLHPP
jgi:hypothetical protein